MKHNIFIYKNKNTILNSIKLSFKKFNFYKIEYKYYNTPDKIPIIMPSNSEFGNLLDIKEEGGYIYYLNKKHKELGPLFYFYIYDRLCLSLGHPKYWQYISNLSAKTHLIRLFMKNLFGSLNTVALQNSEERNRRYEKYIIPFVNIKTVEEKHSKIFIRNIINFNKRLKKYSSNNIKMPLIEELSICVLKNVLELLLAVYDITDSECVKIYNYLTFCILNIELQSFDNNVDKILKEEIDYKINYIHTFIKRNVDKRLEYLKDNKSINNKSNSNKYDFEVDLFTDYDSSSLYNKKYCLVDYLSQEYNKEVIYTDVTAFFFASIHNNISTLFSTIYNLSKHNDKQILLFQEIENSLKDNSITPQSIRQLRYLRMCINESMRIIPPVNTSSRTNNESDIIISNFIIPKDTTFITPFTLASYNEDVWKNYKDFIPERFKDSLNYKLQHSPFGFAGGRICPGKNITWIMNQLILTNIFKNFSLFICDNKIELNEVDTIKKSRNLINYKYWKIKEHKNLFINDSNLNLFYGSGTVVLDEVFLKIKERSN